MTHEDIQKLQVVERNAQEARKEFILLDQSDDAWNLLRSSTSGRVDIVLDNCFPKTSPWFVSDVTPVDFYEMFPLLTSETFFNEFLPSPEQRIELDELVQRWKAYLDCGRFSLSLPEDWSIGEPSEMADFWTTPYPFALLPAAAPALAASLENSKLVIFKGDLNYRKLTADVQWPSSTSFVKALGEVKADVVVGITEALAENLQASDPKWRVNGKYALISFCPKE
ncbi:hypothetical protein Clacol_003960 [Clathrus columnatus]|uniref:Sugar phosphate phosphatase n=1 Tax=Clathrus columnatus TaxID=1419009 RepID=A0AAV5A522_9AGAM|nr:hypothetical protein Clacol_003960 [Clathrus columnatus]